MAESKYGKYIVTEPKANIVKPPWSPQGPVPSRVAYIDNEVVDGAFYMECVWIMPEMIPHDGVELEKHGPKAHTHDYDEILGFFGSDTENARDLGGEAVLWLGDEKHLINKSCLVFIPKGLQHCPLYFSRVNKPIFHFSVGAGQMYF
jgi:hypothetical protein